MKTFKNEDIRSWNPCYDPRDKYSNEEASHTVLTIIDDDNLSCADRLWVLLRTELVSEKLMRLFAVYCARSCVTSDTDKRSLAAIEVAERFANGAASADELAAARAAARAAAESAARAAARAAAESAQIEHLRKMIIAGIETGDVK